mmetsp:Transcript_77610/g.214477  ORF Transcript_77610/g.214477 Transcript_77610/m.214477 type:complete len:333 (-) Transcript_77610:137-1135(-)
MAVSGHTAQRLVGPRGLAAPCGATGAGPQRLPGLPRAALRCSRLAAVARAGLLAAAATAGFRQAGFEAFTQLRRLGAAAPPAVSRTALGLREVAETAPGAVAVPKASAAPFDVVMDFSGNGTAFALHRNAVPLAPPTSDAVQYHIDTFSPGFVVDNVLNREACRRLVDLVEEIGFTERWSQRLGVVTLFVDEEFERDIFERVKPFLPDHMGGRPIGINRRWAVIKYGPGEYMNSHIDGHVPGTVRVGDELAYASGTRSYMSALFWLADDVVGGETVFTFPQGGVWVKVPPRTGAALFFNHGQNAVSNPLHHGGSVVSGYKYLVRSDVIYSLA